MSTTVTTTEITAAADALSDPLTMLGVNPEEVPEDLTAETTAQTLARIALTAGATARRATTLTSTLDQETDLVLDQAVEAAAREHYARSWGPNPKPYELGAHEWDTGLVPEETKQYHRDAVRPVVVAASAPISVAGLVWGLEQLAAQLEANAEELTGSPITRLTGIVRGVAADYRQPIGA